MSLLTDLSEKCDLQAMDILALRKQVRRLEDENAKLREFATRLVEYVDPASHQDTCCIECPAYKRCYGKSTCTFPDWALEEADELGIEVDN